MQNTCVCVYVCVGVWENICDSVCLCLCMYTCENIHVCVCMCVCVCHIAKCSKCNNFFNVKYLFSHRKHDALRSSKLFLLFKKKRKIFVQSPEARPSFAELKVIFKHLSETVPCDLPSKTQVCQKRPNT